MPVERAVHPAFRRMGIAKALLDAIEEYAVEKGISRIDLTVWDFNEDAIAFYKASGYNIDMLRMYKTV